MVVYEPETVSRQAIIKVVGVGGAGGNAIDTMIRQGLEGAEFIAINTDKQALERNLAPLKLNIGVHLTRGLGAGADPEIGRKAAEEDRDRIRQVLEGADMVFIAAGMGKGTGTGGAPVVAEIAKELDILTIAVVTRPFSYEGKQREKNAERGLEELTKIVDTLIVIPNDRLLSVADKKMGFKEAFRLVDQILYQSVRGITDIVTVPGEINVDFADVRRVMRNRGMAVMGVGEAEGERRAVSAAESAIHHPLLEDIQVDGAMALLVNISGNEKVGIHEVQEACEFLKNKVHEDADIIAGIALDPSLGDKVRVTVVATGFRVSREDHRRPPLTLVPPESPQTVPVIPPQVPRLNEQLGKTLYDSDEYDIPAFLRKPKKK
jgi:cell division protein FtsZ